MKALIRTDSSLLIGSGHVYRCLTLAQSLRNKGISVEFACRKLDGNIISLIEEKQFKVHILSAPEVPQKSSDIYEAWAGVPLAQEINEMETLQNHFKPHWIIVDHYSLSAEWENSLGSKGAKIFAIDDIQRQHACDALLDQNYNPEAKAAYRNNSLIRAQLFLGPQFSLLGSAFRELMPRKRSFQEIRKVIAFFGGSDLTGETLKLARAVRGKFPGMMFDLVVGKNSPHLPAIKSISETASQFQLHVQTNNMSQLLAQSDLFIGGGGTVTWERMYLGLPGLCVSVADNQVEIAKALHHDGIHKYLGHWSEDIDYERIIRESIEARAVLQEYSVKSLSQKVGCRTHEIIELLSTGS